MRPRVDYYLVNHHENLTRIGPTELPKEIFTFTCAMLDLKNHTYHQEKGHLMISTSILSHNQINRILKY
jgi:hypothetical protein